MSKETNDVQPAQVKPRALDQLDRKILGALSVDATRSYADLSEFVGLSTAAIHERVKRMRLSGVIKGTRVAIEGALIGKSVLAFVHVEATGWGKTQALIGLGDLPEVEEIHSVTGDTSIILKVRVASSIAMEGFLWRLYRLEQVRTTRTYMVLSTHVERGVQSGITQDLEHGPHVI